MERIYLAVRVWMTAKSYSVEGIARECSQASMWDIRMDDRQTALKADLISVSRI